jgi:hypothetical protein
MQGRTWEVDVAELRRVMLVHEEVVKERPVVAMDVVPIADGYLLSLPDPHARGHLSLMWECAGSRAMRCLFFLDFSEVFRGHMTVNHAA